MIETGMNQGVTAPKKNNMKRNRPTYERKLTIVSPLYPSCPMTKWRFRNILQPPTRSIRYDSNGETTMMTGHKGKVTVETDGRTVWKGLYVHATHNLARFLSSSHIHPLHLTATQRTSHLPKEIEGTERAAEVKQGREKRGEPPKKASIWETEFFISIHKEGGQGGFLVLLSSRKTKKERGREGGKDTNHKTPLSCLLLSLNSAYLRTVLLIMFFLFLFSLLLYFVSRIAFCLLPSSSVICA